MAWCSSPYLAERFFGFRLGRRQWVGVTITAAGLVVIGLTGGGVSRLQRASLAALIAVEGLLLGAAGGALFGVSRPRDQVPHQDDARSAGRGREPMDARGADRRSQRLLRLRT